MRAWGTRDLSVHGANRAWELSLARKRRRTRRLWCTQTMEVPEHVLSAQASLPSRVEACVVRMELRGLVCAHANVTLSLTRVSYPSHERFTGSHLLLEGVGNLCFSTSHTHPWEHTRTTSKTVKLNDKNNWLTKEPMAIKKIK